MCGTNVKGRHDLGLWNTELSEPWSMKGKAKIHGYHMSLRACRCCISALRMKYLLWLSSLLSAVPVTHGELCHENFSWKVQGPKMHTFSLCAVLNAKWWNISLDDEMLLWLPPSCLQSESYSEVLLPYLSLSSHLNFQIVVVSMCLLQDPLK